MAVTVLDQRQRVEIGLGAVAGRLEMIAPCRDRVARRIGQAGPDQRLGHVERRRQQDKPAYAPGGIGVGGEQPAQQQQGEPAAHARADDDAAPAGEGGEGLHRLGEPARDRAVGEVPGGFAMAGIVEAQAWPAAAGGMGGNGFGLGAAHVGFEAAQPEKSARALGLRRRPIRAPGNPRAFGAVESPQPGCIRHFCVPWLFSSLDLGKAFAVYRGLASS